MKQSIHTLWAGLAGALASRFKYNPALLANAEANAAAEGYYSRGKSGKVSRKPTGAAAFKRAAKTRNNIRARAAK